MFPYRYKVGTITPFLYFSHSMGSEFDPVHLPRYRPWALEKCDLPEVKLMLCQQGVLQPDEQKGPDLQKVWFSEVGNDTDIDWTNWPSLRDLDNHGSVYIRPDQDRAKAKKIDLYEHRGPGFSGIGPRQNAFHYLDEQRKLADYLSEQEDKWAAPLLDHILQVVQMINDKVEETSGLLIECRVVRTDRNARTRMQYQFDEVCCLL